MPTVFQKPCVFIEIENQWDGNYVTGLCISFITLLLLKDVKQISLSKKKTKLFGKIIF